MDETVELSLDSEGDYEVKEYRTTFDANGYPERETPLPGTALSPATTVPDTQGTLRLLWEQMQGQGETIKLLERSNVALQARLDVEQTRLKQLRGAALVLFLCGAAVALWLNHSTGQQLDDTTDRLLLAIGKGEKQTERTRGIAVETRAKLEKANSRFDGRLVAQSGQLQALSRTVQNDRKNSRDVHHVIGRVMADVNLGHQQLAARENPHQAKVYAQRALNRLDAYQTQSDRTEKESALATGLLAPSYQTAWNLAARSALVLGEIDLVMEYGGKLIDSIPDDPAGYEFEGIALLYQTVGGKNADDERRSKQRQAAVEKLQTALSHSREGNEVLLLLAAAHFDDNNFRLASDRAQQFRQSYPQSTAAPLRLGNRTEAAIALAGIWRELADSAVGRDVKLDANEYACKVARAGLTVVESRIHEEILNGIAQSPNRFGFTGKRAKEVAAYCQTIAEALRTAQCPESNKRPTLNAHAANYPCTSPDCKTGGRRLVVNNYTKTKQSLIVNGIVQVVAPGQHVFHMANDDAVVAHLTSEPKRTWTDWQPRKDGKGLELVVGIDDSPQR